MCAIDDVRNTFAVDHYTMVVAIIRGYEDPFAFCVVRRDESLAGTEIICWESGDRATLVLDGTHFLGQQSRAKYDGLCLGELEDPRACFVMGSTLVLSC